MRGYTQFIQVVGIVIDLGNDFAMLDAPATSEHCCCRLTRRRHFASKTVHIVPVLTQ